MVFLRLVRANAAGFAHDVDGVTVELASGGRLSCDALIGGGRHFIPSFEAATARNQRILQYPMWRAVDSGRHLRSIRLEAKGELRVWARSARLSPLGSTNNLYSIPRIGSGG